MTLSLSEKIKHPSHNAKNIRYGEMSTRIFETYKNYVIPHGRRILKMAYDMSMATMGAYPLSQHALPHYKCMLRC